MDIIYLSSSCSNRKFDELREQGVTRKLPQAQKYHSLLMEGIAENLEGTIYAISAFPVNRRWTKRVFFPREEETVGKIRYIYDVFINLPILRQWTRIRRAKKQIKTIYCKNPDCAIICDVLNQSLSKAGRQIGGKLGIPVVGIVTDVPGHTSGARRKNDSFLRQKVAKYAEHIAEKNLGKYDAYLLLTEAMNDVVNVNHRPYIVLEGHCDSKMEQRAVCQTEKSHPRIAMYAGGIHKEFGIERLVNAFVRGNFTDWELHIYGDGNYQKELTKLVQRIPNVKYHGVQPNGVIVENQLKASVLLNPRLTNEEYVKYSFPSKTMECMASGTPLCTTKLPGMPPEYYPYVYFIEEETEDGMLAALQNVLSRSAEEHHAFGIKAKEFVMAEKTNVVQAKKLLDFIDSVRKKQ